MKTKISIIIPAYNTLQYLGKCIDTLLNQTLQNLEIILVDDCSSQDFSSLIKQYDDARLKYFRNDSLLGPGASRNIGIANASGEYITFCDSDDWVDLNLYKSVIESMEKTNAEIGVFSIIRERDGRRDKKEYLINFQEYYTLTSDMTMQILGGCYSVGIDIFKACWNKVYKKDFIDECKAIFEEGIYFQGTLFSVYTILRARKITCIPNVYYHHYRRDNSIIQSFSEKHIVDFKECFIRMKNYFISVDKYEQYKLVHFRLCEDIMNMIVQQIFEFEKDESKRKFYLQNLLRSFTSVIPIEDYFAYTTSEEIRRHIQPNADIVSLY